VTEIGGQGVVRRSEIAAALASGRAPTVEEAVVYCPHAHAREVGDLLMKSLTGVVLVAAAVTLHDILRTQAAISE